MISLKLTTQFMLNPMPEPVPFFNAGRLRALATSTAKRISALPEPPPVAEAIPGYETITWQGFLVPAGTPKAVVDRLHTELVQTLKDAEFASRLRGMGWKSTAPRPPNSPSSSATRT